MEYIEDYMTQIPLSHPLNFKMEGPLLMLGSCFADNIYNYLKDRLLPVVSNPLGPAYNPLSIAQLIDKHYLEQSIKEPLIVQTGGLFGSYECHTKLNQESSQQLVQTLDSRKKQLLQALTSSRILTLSLGSSYYYSYEGFTVLNCQKQKNSLFDHRMASVDLMYDKLSQSLDLLDRINDHYELILTISPVRYMTDNPIDNSLNKGRLHELVNRIIHSRSRTHYFPSYEIVMDELRDYRWYEQDLRHINKQAQQIIGRKFLQYIGSPELQQYEKEALKISKLHNHILLNPHSEESRQFVESRKAKTEQFLKKYPFVKFGE
ncbi:GSCFA domain-containing protein [Spirochaeta cellobiosiphila]|uniref:GSCFA domain-containing protein n=1 Tax=Spirochaeta cellobiosiphila TaxID=504483 RepID=UPI0004111F0A|nr:GSCFA domain-containing protein [Spirochaeta cellobiosiphila]